MYSKILGNFFPFMQWWKDTGVAQGWQDNSQLTISVLVRRFFIGRSQLSVIQYPYAIEWLSLDRPVSHMANFFRRRRCCFNKNKNNLVMRFMYSFFCCLPCVNSTPPPCVRHFLPRTSMHWLAFIVVIHRFKLLNSPWVPLCHVIPPFQPKVLSTQRERERESTTKKLRTLLFSPAVCAFAIVVCMIFWFTRLTLFLSFIWTHHRFSLQIYSNTFFLAKQYFPSD